MHCRPIFDLILFITFTCGARTFGLVPFCFLLKPLTIHVCSSTVFVEQTIVYRSVGDIDPCIIGSYNLMLNVGRRPHYTMYIILNKMFCNWFSGINIPVDGFLFAIRLFLLHQSWATMSY